MITGTPKPIKEVLGMLEPYSRVVVAGCFGCVTVCRVGGEKEVQVLSSSLRLAREAKGNKLEIKEVCLERQCDPEYLDQLRPYVADYDAVLSIACGAGIQFVAEKYPTTPVLPGINTGFLGVAERQGEWAERCQELGAGTLRRLCTAPDRRYLPGKPLRQITVSWPMRRLCQGHL